jgi:putative membrane protein
MKSLVRSFVFNFFALQLVENLVPGVFFNEGLKTLALTAIALAFFNMLLKPLITLLLLPINLLTLGMFRWVINVIILHLLTLFITEFEIGVFNLPGFNIYGLTVPEIYLNPFLNTALTSFVLSFVFSLLSWLK